MELEKIPYTITSEEFGMEDDYETISLTYYSDGVLVSDNGLKMSKEDIDQSVGSDYLNYIGINDSIYIRNDHRKCDYEILVDPWKTYADMLKERPYLHDE
jgi:hypothetical protein